MQTIKKIKCILFLFSSYFLTHLMQTQQMKPHLVSYSQEKGQISFNKEKDNLKLPGEGTYLMFIQHSICDTQRSILAFCSLILAFYWLYLHSCMYPLMFG